MLYQMGWNMCRGESGNRAISLSHLRCPRMLHKSINVLGCLFFSQNGLFKGRRSRGMQIATLTHLQRTCAPCIIMPPLQSQPLSCMSVLGKIDGAAQVLTPQVLPLCAALASTCFLTSSLLSLSTTAAFSKPSPTLIHGITALESTEGWCCQVQSLGPNPWQLA